MFGIFFKVTPVFTDLLVRRRLIHNTLIFCADFRPDFVAPIVISHDPVCSHFRNSAGVFAFRLMA